MLDQADVLDLDWDYFLPAAFAVIGGILLAAGLAGPPRKRP
jgi:hypothetical protein